MKSCNNTLQNETVDLEVPYSNGLTFHHMGLIISASFGLAAIAIADYLILQHALHYLRPEEQKHIIRVLFMIPVYAAVSFLSYYFYRNAIYFEVLRDCYEAFAIASFFTLVCNYIAPNLHAQKDFFRKQRPKNWIFPISWLQKCTGGAETGWLRKPASGLTWFNIVYVCVFQYCFIRVFFTIVSVITEALGRLCQNSDNPAFAHVWVTGFEGVSVTIAMYALIQFYYQLNDEISEHKPFLKLVCIKLVIFFSFWQSLVISTLISHNTLKTNDHIAYPDLAIGIPSLLLCIEMAIFAVLHLFAFPWRKPYSLNPEKSITSHFHSSASRSGSPMGNDPVMHDPLHVPGAGYSGKPHYQGGWLGTNALLDAFNPWDIVKASARGFRWLFVGRKHRHLDESYQQEGVEPYATKLQPMSPLANTAAGGFPAVSVTGPTEYTGARAAVGSPRGGSARSNVESWAGIDDPRTTPLDPGDHPELYSSTYQAPHASSWRPDPDEDEAWRSTIGPGEDSRRQSSDAEDHAGLLRNAMRPARTTHSDDGA